MCHEKSFCDDCHGLQIPHPEGWAKGATGHAATAQLSLLLDHLPGQKGRAVADPYYGDVSEFELCWQEVDLATRMLAEWFAEL